MFLSLLFVASRSHATANSIHTVGKAVCTKAGDEHRITMRSFGDKPVPCDVILKKSDDKFKKLKVIVDSKKDPAICREQFSGFQKSLINQGYACVVSLDPSLAKSKDDPKPDAKPADKSAAKVESPPVSEHLPKAAISKAKTLPEVSLKPIPKTLPAKKELAPPPPPAPGASNPKEKQVPPPPPTQ